MRGKNKTALSVKVFLWVFAALTLCGTAIYVIMLNVLPKQYQMVSDRQMETNVDALVSELSDIGYGDGVKRISDFCIQNNSVAALTSDNETLYFGEKKDGGAGSTSYAVGTDIVFSDSEREYMLVLSSSASSAGKISDIMLRFLPVIFAIIIILSIMSALICSKVIVAPIAKISRVSERMSALDMTQRCEVKGNDEISVLAESLNTLADRLQSVMRELEGANAQLTSDVKKLRTLETQRGIFFAAVSHELKTPLTILKGQLENMMLGFGDYQNHEKYLPETLKAADSIERLVSEIITISKMGNMDLRDTLQRVSLISTIEDAIKAVSPLAVEKDIVIHQNVDKDIILSVNIDLWNKALSNIIGNAVRHSPRGEEVFIFLQSGEEEDVLVAENTGVFISEDDMPHIFTPFFRTDRSRSKATGGSGLGLYIVKTILDLHGMGCKLENTEKGVAFYLKLNCAKTG